jgi:UMF1 family MFS transporter
LGLLGNAATTPAMTENRAHASGNSTSRRRGVVAWALYDWANSAFATTVLAAFFPFLFKKYWSADVDVAVSTARLGFATAAASLAVALSAPVLGAMADAGRSRKRWLALFATIGIIATGAMGAVAKGEWLVALLLFAIASVGFLGSIVFYDSLLPLVAEPGERDRVSAYGYGLGYLGGGLLFLVNVAMVVKPALFGLADAGQAARVSLVTVAVWWAVFSIPLFRRVAEPREARRSGVIGESFRALRTTFGQIRRLKVTFLFLIAFWLYMDGVHTVVRMGVDYGLSIGLGGPGLMGAVLMTQFVAFPAALGFGRLAERWGAQRAILLGIVVYCGVCVYAAFIHNVAGFFILAGVVGLVQGGVQALSRSLYARLIPQRREAEFFGFYNMLGKLAAVLGPALMGATALITSNPRWSIVSILVLFVAGGVVLSRVDLKAGEAAAREG